MMEGRQRQRHSSNRRQSPSTEQTSASASDSDSGPRYSGSHSESKSPLDRPTFTFIDHDDDLTSKRIKDANARKAIRSHVMRDVRRRERLAGLRRVPKRDKRKSQASTGASESGGRHDSFQNESSERLALRSKSASSSAFSTSPPASAGALESVAAEGRHPHLVTPRALQADSLAALVNMRSLPKSWFRDPFSSLPGTDEVPDIVSNLVFYWKNVFIPTTFPEEHRVSRRAEIELMVRSAFSDPGSFFGLMSMCAAHRAILAGRHADLADHSQSSHRLLQDPDYYIMKSKCIREMNVKIQDPEQSLSDQAIDTVINLITSALIVGLFDEARVHLKGLKRMVELRGGIRGESILKAGIIMHISATDVKAATGLLTIPLFPMHWSSPPVPRTLHDRVKPPTGSQLNLLATAFTSNPLLSPELVEILQAMRILLYYSETCRTHAASFTRDEHEFFNALNVASEHRLLSYPYATPASPDDSRLSPQPRTLHPVEGLTRVAAVGFLHHFLIVSPPASGSGRAVTKHLATVLNSCPDAVLSQLPPENYDLLAWALFVAAQGAAGQPDRPLFVKRLAHIARLRHWTNWDEVSSVMFHYLYLSHNNEQSWHGIWAEVMANHGVALSAW